MRTNGLRPRAVGALTVVALSLFLALCLANFGQVAAQDAVTHTGWHLAIASWFVEVFGAGAYVVVVLPFVWGLVVYFREATPSLAMRAAGTLLLACAVAMISGLLQAPAAGLWAGAIGSYTIALTEGLGGIVGVALANAVAWTGSIALFVAALIWATDWMFHTLRKGEIDFTLRERPAIQTEPANADLREPHEEPAPREFVRMDTPGTEAASTMSAPARVSEPVEVKRVPEGFSSDDRGERVVVRGPVGYKDVEFLPPSDELAGPHHQEPEYVEREEPTSILDDELSFAPAEQHEAIETTETPATEIPAIGVQATGLEASAIDEHEGSPLAAASGASDVVIDVLPATAYSSSASTQGATAESGVTLDLFAEVEDTAAVGDTADASAPQTEADAEPTRPRSGIGIPDDSPFVDEFFVMGGQVDASTAGDGASHHDDVESLFTASAPAAESPESLAEVEASGVEVPSIPTPGIEAAPEPAQPAHAQEATAGEPMIVDEVLFAPAAYALIDDIINDEIPAQIAARSATLADAQRAPEPEVTAAEVVDARDEPENASGPDLSRLSAMVLDPLFHDAVSAVLERGRASGMVLQRSFGVGHARGLRVLEQMAAAGIIGEEDTNGSRELLVTQEAWDAFVGAPATGTHPA
jgi:DNA segregation ATPase FtsK/SpoIIIE-like protein